MRRESPLQRLFSYPFRHIRWKIIMPYALLTLLLAGAGTYIATELVTGSLEERFDNQLAEAARVTSDSVVRRERQHLETVRGVAFTEGVAEAVASGDATELRTLVEPLAANNDAQLVRVLDLSGDEVLGIGQAETEELEYVALDDEAQPASWAIARSVLSGERDEIGDKFAQIVELNDDYALFTAGPIFRDDDSLVGVVMVGSTLDSFLPSAKLEALADVTVYDFDGTPIASSFAATMTEEANLAPSDGALAEFGMPSAVRETKSLFGRDFDLLYGELKIRDDVVGIYSVALPSSFILSAGGSTRWQMGGLFAAGTAAVLLTGWFIARSLTKPLLRLVSAARRVTSGDLTARSGVRSADEVGVLATSFDTMTDRLEHQHLATIRSLTSAIDARDPYTAGHSARVGHLAVEIGTALELPPETLRHLEIGGYLHDIGKIGIRDYILLKPGSLTQEERELIERHPQIGLDILAPVDLAPEVVDFVSGHHEKLNGSGYPGHLQGNELGIVPRIAAVSDIYDALTSDRPYRPALTVPQALETMRREAKAGELDRELVGVLETLIPRWEQRRQSEPALQGFRLPEAPLRETA